MDTRLLLLCEDVRTNLREGQMAQTRGTDSQSFAVNTRRDEFVVDMYGAFLQSPRSDRNALTMLLVAYEAGYWAGKMVASESAAAMMSAILKEAGEGNA